MTRSGARGGGLLGGAYAVFERDFLSETSRGRFVAARTAFVVLCAMAALLVLWASGQQSLNDDAGAVVFLSSAFTALALLTMNGSVIAADSIAGERSADTLGLVLAAPVSPWRFVLAKFLSRLGALLVPVVGAVPVASAGLLLGGVAPAAIPALLSAIGMLAVLTVSASVFASAMSRTVARAILLGVALAILLPAAEAFAVGLLSHELGNPIEFGWLDHNPYYAVGVAMVNQRGGFGAALPVLPAWITTCAYSALLLWLAGLRVSREFATGPGSRRVRAARPIRFEMPVLHRAAPRSILFPDTVGSGVLYLISAAIAFGPAPWFGGWQDDHVASCAIAGAIFTSFILLVHGTQAIAPERQHGSLPLLLASPTGPREIHRQLACGAMCHAARLLVPHAVLVTIAMIDGILPVASALLWFASAPLLSLLTFEYGMWRSCRASNAGRSAVTAIAWALAASAAWGTLMVTIAIATKGAAEETAVSLLLAIPPPVAHGFLVALPTDRHWSRTEDWAFWGSVASVALWGLVVRWMQRSSIAALRWESTDSDQPIRTGRSSDRLRANP